jgi:citrate lyase subunit beta / citryl-CoA lyase
MSPTSRMRRSVLYVPASNARAIARAASLDCDGIILDLEDSVAPDAKSEARERAAATLESGILSHKEVILRVNGFDSPNDLLKDDLARLAPFAPDGVLFPKINTAQDVQRAQSALDHHFFHPDIALWLMIETPRAILSLPAIAAERENPASRLHALVIGSNDLGKDLRVAATPSRPALLHALSSTVYAARAYGLAALDGIHTAIDDPADYEAECRQGQALGFDGKTLIHPNQIAAANIIFSPNDALLAQSARIVAAFEDPANAEKGVLVVDGQMRERLHYEQARDILKHP